jgi:hypothetical protein
MLLANFDLYSTFMTKLISTENLSNLFQVPSAVGAPTQLKCTEVQGVTCHKIVLLKLVQNFHTKYYLNSPYP